MVIRVWVKRDAGGVVGHQYKPTTGHHGTIDIAQLEDSAFCTGRIQFVPDQWSLFCSLCRGRALLHGRYLFILSESFLVRIIRINL